MGNRTLQGKFKPKNPMKYKGNVDKVTYRSSWELKLFKYCDNNPAIVKWNSEEVIIPYYNPVKRRSARYFMDVWMKYKVKNGYKESLIEVKPHAETMMPKKPKNKTDKAMINYNRKVATFAVNSAKWNATKKLVENKSNIDFKIFTEYELGIKKKKKAQ